MSNLASEMLSINLFIARMGIRISIHRKELVEELGERYRDFSQGENIRVEVLADLNNFKSKKRIEDAPILFVDNRIIIDHSGYLGWIDIEAGKAQISLPGRKSIEGIDYFLRLVASVMIFEAGGLLLHGAGILQNQIVDLFLGHSGSGKTTIANYSPVGSVLNDDLVVVMNEGKRWIVYSTPFWNPTQIKPLNTFGRLDGIYCLTQDKRVYLERLSPAKAVAELISNTPVIPGDGLRSLTMLERCQNIASSVKSYRLHFLPDNTFWSEIAASKALSLSLVD